MTRAREAVLVFGGLTAVGAAVVASGFWLSGYDAALGFLVSMGGGFILGKVFFLAALIVWEDHIRRG